MNREQAIRYLKKHQPNSRWIPTEHARGRKLPFDLVASLARRKAGGVSKV